MAVLASKQPHCLYDLLTRWRTGELAIDVPLVISNHADHAVVAERFGVPYRHLPGRRRAAKAAQEAAVQALLDEHDVDLVVLARYMQVLSPAFVDALAEPGHQHPPLVPARPSSAPGPYHQAHERGVKLIGVTAHYATEDLDEGPIIEQDVVRVSHRDSVEELVRQGPRPGEGGAGPRRAGPRRAPRAGLRPQDRRLRVRRDRVEARPARQAWPGVTR